MSTILHFITGIRLTEASYFDQVTLTRVWIKRGYRQADGRIKSDADKKDKMRMRTQKDSDKMDKMWMRTKWKNADLFHCPNIIRYSGNS